MINLNENNENNDNHVLRWRLLSKYSQLWLHFLKEKLIWTILKGTFGGYGKSVLFNITSNVCSIYI